MSAETLAAALEQEHHDIDDGIADFAASLESEAPQPEPLHRAIEGLKRHIYLEEAFLFPALREAGFQAPVFVMVREHGEIWRSLDAIESGLAGGAAPTPLLEQCKTLATQLTSHNFKEERILYPKADEVLHASASDELKRFMASGKRPEGWVTAGLETAGA